MNLSQAENLGQSIQAVRPLQIGAVPLIYPVLSGLDVRQTTNRLVASEADIDLQAYRPGMIFLNGEYWGVLNIRERQNEHYLYYHHGVNPDSVDILRWPDIVIEGSGSSGNTISGNYIGLAADGTALGNGGNGIAVYFGAQDNTIGGASTG